jgi:hypothetical protein
MVLLLVNLQAVKPIALAKVMSISKMIAKVGVWVRWVTAPSFLSEC